MRRREGPAAPPSRNGVACAVRACLPGILASCVGVATAQEPPDVAAPFDVAPIMECRARAIVQLELADWERSSIGESAALAVREMADFAMILGFWGHPLDSVGMASRDMATGERLMIANARRVNDLANAWDPETQLDAGIAECVGPVWDAAKAVIDRAMLDENARRAR
jgi:hypothetical protein